MQKNDTLFEIKITKCRLLLYEYELYKLPAEVLAAAIKRGKSQLRADRVAEYYNKQAKKG